jgi:hypothetical protein
MIDKLTTSTMSLPRGRDDLSAGSESAPTSLRPTTLGFWRAFGAAFLAAMHESRERQAAREIQYHRQLIEEARAYRLNRPTPRPQSGGTLVKIAIVTVIIVFGVLHIIGGTMLERSVRAQGETGTAVLSRE